ncbi:hypothetical protein ACFQZE_07430 [Paenibacillus sp. GCM10027627]|uniref:hypothetical protein n=1 Tax=unclassified Paenibacillus TaxID=185978 RepID=UPI0036407944
MKLSTSIFSLSDNMTNSKQDLLEYINYFHDTTTQEYEDAVFLIQTDEDLRMWFQIWSGDPDNIAEANWKLREWKVVQRLNEYEPASDLLGLDVGDFLETYFCQVGGERSVWELEKVLGEMNFRELWDLHMKYPMARIEYY